MDVNEEFSRIELDSSWRESWLVLVNCQTAGITSISDGGILTYFAAGLANKHQAPE